jgi:Zn-finger nucleic acid-binding protein
METQQRCPVDASALRLAERDGYLAAECARCHGIWLPGTTLRRMRAGAADRPVADSEPGGTDARRCPEDETPLSTVEAKGIVVDRCPTCNGIWFDAGEMERLMAGGTDRARQHVTGDVAGMSRGELLFAAADIVSFLAEGAYAFGRVSASAGARLIDFITDW